MNLKVLFQSLATNLITGVFKDVAQKVIIRRPIMNNYQEYLGALISSYQEYEVVGIVGPWRDDSQLGQKSDAIQTNDLQLIISKVTLEIEPELNVDTCILPDGSEWEIIFAQKDAAEASIKYRLSKDLEE